METDAAAHLRSASPAATARLGARLGRCALAGDVLLLDGELGAGKTAFTQGVAAGLGFRGVINSPTFTILKEHRGGRLPLYHFDLYRIDDPAELEALGFGDYLDGDGLAVVEWAARARVALPADALALSFAVVGPRARHIQATAGGPRSRRLLAAWRREDADVAGA